MAGDERRDVFPRRGTAVGDGDLAGRCCGMEPMRGADEWEVVRF